MQQETGSGLDPNLWPLCVGQRVHSVDKLILTQMCPGSIQEDLVSRLHTVKQHFGLEADCVCIKKEDHVDKPDVEQMLSQEESFNISSLECCPYCGISLNALGVKSRYIHFASHLSVKLTGEQNDGICDVCQLNTGKALLACHKASVHKSVDNYFNGEFWTEERRRQANVRLDLDDNEKCEICGCMFTNTTTENKRKHFFSHLEESLSNELEKNEPFKCTGCGHVEISWRRLVFHVSL